MKLKEMIQETYEYNDMVNGKSQKTSVNYNICIRDGKVEFVYNELGSQVEKKSFIFEYFSNKFNK